MDSRNWFELVIRKYEVEKLTPQQREQLAKDLQQVEDKLAQILDNYEITY